MIDRLGPLVDRLIQRALAPEQWISWATVLDYDAATHRVTTRLQPRGIATGWLRVLVPHDGAAHPITPGMQGIVALERGTPLALIGVTYSAVDPAPSTALAITGDMFISGTLTVAGILQLGRVLGQQTAADALRGAFAFLAPSGAGIPGTPDALLLCVQQADGTPIWRDISTPQIIAGGKDSIIVGASSVTLTNSKLTTTTVYALTQIGTPPLTERPIIRTKGTGSVVIGTASGSTVAGSPLEFDWLAH